MSINVGEDHMKWVFITLQLRFYNALSEWVNAENDTIMNITHGGIGSGGVRGKFSRLRLTSDYKTHFFLSMYMEVIVLHDDTHNNPTQRSTAQVKWSQQNRRLSTHTLKHLVFCTSLRRLWDVRRGERHDGGVVSGQVLKERMFCNIVQLKCMEE